MKKPTSYVYQQRTVQTSQDQLRGRNERVDRMRQNLNLNYQNQGINNQHYRKHNSPDATKLRNYQNIQNQGQLFTSKNYNSKTKANVNVKNNDVNGEQTRQELRKQRQLLTQNNQNYASNMNLNYKQQLTLTKNASSPKLFQSSSPQQQQNLNKPYQNKGREKQKLYTESDEYQKLHQKLNSIEDKIMNMKKNIQRKREQKQKMLEKQKKQKLEAEKQRAQSQKKNSLKGLVTQMPEHKQLHTFERNPYSPRHSIYYVSQVVRAYLDEKSMAREHITTSLHILRVLEKTQIPTDEEMKKRRIDLPLKKGKQGKKCIVFDLDQTLIHCNDTLSSPYDVKLPIKFPTGEVIEAGINIRPYSKQILKNLAKNFEVIVFTASHSCYANVVLDYLDPTDQLIDHRLFREHCYQTPEGMYVKDLRVMNRDLKDILLVDNAAYSYAFQLDNGIPILPYYHGTHDYELNTLEKYIQQFALVNDVRQINRKTFMLHEYRNYYNEPQRLVEQLYINEQMQNHEKGKK